VAAPTVSEVKTLQLKEAQRAELDRMTAEMETWRRERAAVLERWVIMSEGGSLLLTECSIQRKKAERRGMKGQMIRSSLVRLDDIPDRRGVRRLQPILKRRVPDRLDGSDPLVFRTLGPDIEEHLDKIIRDLDETGPDVPQGGYMVPGAGIAGLDVEVEMEDLRQKRGENGY
jgi:hypothetical protein